MNILGVQIMLRSALVLFCVFILTNNLNAGWLHLFEGRPSSRKKCDSFWPNFSTKTQIQQIFDKDWSQITLKANGITKVYYFNLIGIRRPNEVKDFEQNASRLFDNKKDLDLVPFRQDKSDPDHICHYAFKITHQGTENKALLQIGRVEHMDLATEYDKTDLLIKDMDYHLKNLAEALPHLAPAIEHTVKAVIEAIALGQSGIASTQDQFEEDVSHIQTPLSNAVENWTLFFDTLLGTKDDPDCQIPPSLEQSLPGFASTPNLERPL